VIVRIPTENMTDGILYREQCGGSNRRQLVKLKWGMVQKSWGDVYYIGECKALMGVVDWVIVLK